VTSAQTRNVEYLEEIWEKAVELAMTRCTGTYAHLCSRTLHRYLCSRMLTYAAQVSMLTYADVRCTRMLPVSFLDILVPKVRYFSTKLYFSNLYACHLKSAEAAYTSASRPHILVPQGLIYWYLKAS
jgi:hypothetical protein